MPDDPGKEKDELLKGLEEAEREAKRIEAASKDALENARLVRDTAPQLRILFQETPVSGLPPEEWVRQNQNVKSWLGVAKSMPPTFTDVSTFGAVSQVVANTAISGVMITFPLRLPPAPPASPPPSPYPIVVQQATERLAAVVEKYPSMDKARIAIRRLGLDTRRGDSKSALQLLEEAAHCPGHSRVGRGRRDRRPARSSRLHQRMCQRAVTASSCAGRGKDVESKDGFAWASLWPRANEHGAIRRSRHRGRGHQRPAFCREGQEAESPGDSAALYKRAAVLGFVLEQHRRVQTAAKVTHGARRDTKAGGIHQGTHGKSNERRRFIQVFILTEEEAPLRSRCVDLEVPLRSDDTDAFPNSARLVRVSCLECVFRVHAFVVPPV